MKPDDPALRRKALNIAATILILLIVSASILTYYEKPAAAGLWDKLFPVIALVVGGLTAWAFSQQRKN